MHYILLQIVLAVFTHRHWVRGVRWESGTRQSTALLRGLLSSAVNDEHLCFISTRSVWLQGVLSVFSSSFMHSGPRCGSHIQSEKQYHCIRALIKSCARRCTPGRVQNVHVDVYALCCLQYHHSTCTGSGKISNNYMFVFN